VTNKYHICSSFNSCRTFVVILALIVLKKPLSKLILLLLKVNV
jgi:hypothetical protein